MYEQLSEVARKTLMKEFKLNDVSITWQRPQESEFGDIATAVALQISKQVGRAPREIAELVLKDLEKHPDVEKVEIAGPGYINIWFTCDALLRQLNTTREACTARVTRTKEAPVIVEYSQPNIAKPLGVHHLLTTLIGQAIANLYEHAGYNTIKWNYLGDWGTQFGKLAVAVEKWGDGRPASGYSIDELLELYVRFHDEVENDPTLEDQGREAFRRLEQGDEELLEFWKEIVASTKEALSKVYHRLNVSFDTDIGESFYQDKIDPILEEGISKGVFTEGEGGSLIVEFPEECNFPPYLVRKSDGATLYSTRDIAQMRYRMDTYHPQAIFIVTDIAQKLHFEQLEETCNMLDWDLPEFENILFGRMRFADRKMSTRKGSVLKLEEVLEEAVARADKVIDEHGESIQTDDRSELASMMGLGSLAYGVLSQNRKMDLVFDWDKMLSFEGNSAPYLQYTHARARSVLRKVEVDRVDFPETIESLEEKERGLLNTLLQFDQTLTEARESHMPHVLANYLHKLCQDFNAFYNELPILKADEPARSLRLALTSSTAEVLKTGAEILTLRVPDQM